MDVREISYYISKWVLQHPILLLTMFTISFAALVFTFGMRIRKLQALLFIGVLIFGAYFYKSTGVDSLYWGQLEFYWLISAIKSVAKNLLSFY